MSELIYYSQSRAMKDWSCPRSRYYTYDYDGVGAVQDGVNTDAYLGTVIHSALAGIATWVKRGEPVNIDLLADTARVDVLNALTAQDGEVASAETLLYAAERAALVEGLIRGYYRHVWPRLIQQYPTILEVEREVTYEHNGMCFMAKPDLLLQNDGSGEVAYVEFKTTSSKKESWVNSWSTAIQMHASVMPVEATLGYRPDVVIVQGLYKSWESYGKLNSPFPWAYTRSANPPFVKAGVEYTYKPGYKKSPVWEMPGGVKQWVAAMPAEVLQEQFPQVPPIYPREYMIERFFAQQEYREKAVMYGKQLLEKATPDERIIVLDKIWPQHFDKCNQYYGGKCEFSRACHSGVTDLFNAGFVKKPQDHLEAFKGVRDAKV